jgi:nitroreductase
MAQTQQRRAGHPVDARFVERWSPRAYTGEALPKETLHSILEAARWAPSGGNSQPWRFVYALKGGPEWDTFVGLLLPGNRVWAERAGALVLLVSETHRLRDGVKVPSSFHSFDAGAAWQNIALQARELGWSTRAIGGYERDAARKALGVSAGFDLEILIAIGRPGPKDVLPLELQEKEFPSPRRPLEELVFEGRFEA